MSFLWPFAWFLTLLALPIILLYLIRTLPKRRPVSTLLFWDQIQPQLRSSPLWRKLRRFLSLLLQFLFLFLLIFLLARPLLPWQAGEPETVVFIIDTSASMSANERSRNSLEKALAVLRERIRGLRADDEATIITAGSSPEVIRRWTPNRKLLLAGASAIVSQSVESDIPAALELAASLARQRERARIVLFTDGVIGQRIPVDEIPLETVLIEPPSEPNTGLVEFSARRSRLDPGSILVRARVVGSENADPNETHGRLELRLNNRLTDVIPVEFDDKLSLEKVWTIPEPGPARIEARIATDTQDPLSTDDSATINIDGVETLAVRLVSPSDPFLEAILTALDGIEAARVSPEDLPSEPEEALYLFHKTVPPEAFTAPALVLIDPAGEGIWGERLEGETEESIITKWDEGHDLLHLVDLDQVVFPHFARYAPPASANVFASSFENPILFGEWDTGPRWLATAFGLDQSDLVYRTVFPILVGNIIRSLSLSADSASAPLPGETESRLAAFPEGFLPDKTAEKSDAPALSLFSLPLRHWLLLAAIAWLFLEWRLFHRRITE